LGFWNRAVKRRGLYVVGADSRRISMSRRIDGSMEDMDWERDWVIEESF